MLQHLETLLYHHICSAFMHGRTHSVSPPPGCNTLLYKAKVAVKGIDVPIYVLGESAVPCTAFASQKSGEMLQ